MTMFASTGNKTQIIELMKKSFNTVVSSYEKKVNDELLDWLVIKINVLLKNQFNGDLYIEKYTRLVGKLTTRTYDLAIKSTKYKRVLLIISVNKITNDINKTFFSSYKDTIFNTMSLGMENIPYYTLTISPLKNLNSVGQLESFNKKNLIRIYNGNNSTMIPGVNKIMLLDGDIKGNKFNIVENLNYILPSEISKTVSNSILMQDIKELFVDIYNILQKYV